MSAFMLSRDAWQQVVNAITMPDPYGNNVASELLEPWGRLLQRWYRANDIAVSSRYSEATGDTAPELEPSPAIRRALEVVKLGSRMCRPEAPGPLVAGVKMLECLRYQCSETVPAHLEPEHKAAMELIDRAISILALRLVHTLPAYDKADWG